MAARDRLQAKRRSNRFWYPRAGATAAAHRRQPLVVRRRQFVIADVCNRRDYDSVIIHRARRRCAATPGAEA